MSRFTTSDGLGLFVFDSGGAGPVVLFSHGLLFDHRQFEDQIEALRGRFRCVAWDHRGQGGSDVPAGSVVSIERCYEDAVELINGMGLGAVHFVGLSMGGFVGMRLAARHPELIRSLSLLETSAEPEPKENLPKYQTLAWAARILGVGLLVPRVEKILFARSFLADPAKALVRQRWRERLGRNRRAIYKACQGVFTREGVTAELSRIVAPTLVIVGDEDVATVPAKAERIREGIAGALLLTIRGAGHSSSIEQPEQVNEALSQHIEAAELRYNS